MPGLEFGRFLPSSSSNKSFVNSRVTVGANDKQVTKIVVFAISIFVVNFEKIGLLQAADLTLNDPSF